jgi:DNA-binding MarR family transcriptional regulator
MASPANTGDAMSNLETELAVLGRTLEGMGRRSEIHRELDRSSYLISRTLSTDGAVSISGLATRLGLDATTVTRQVTTMEGSGLVARRPDPDDGRVRLVELTDLGARKMRQVQRARERRVRELTAAWSGDDLQQLAQLLGRLNEALFHQARS